MIRLIILLLGIAVWSCGCSERAPSAKQNETNTRLSSIAETSDEEPVSDSEATLPTYDGPGDVLQEGIISVDIMHLAVPRRSKELADRMQQAARNNPAWWLEHVNRAKPGEPLPYDSRLGVTKLEYEEFLSLSKKVRMQKGADTELKITRIDHDIYRIDGGRALPDLTGIEVDLVKDVVRTPYGELAQRSQINAPPHTALGAWTGTQWECQKPGGDGVTGLFAKLAVGRLQESGRCVIYYDVKKVNLDGKVDISHVLTYDLPSR